MDVSIVIVNYNTYDLLVDCIDSVRRFTPAAISYEIIVVDNNSAPAEVARLKTLSGIKLILSDKNAGFGAGNNLGVQHAAGKFLLLLNADTVFVADALSIFMSEYSRLQTDHKVGVLGAQLTDRNSLPVGSYYRFPRLKDVIFDRYRDLFKYVGVKMGIAKRSSKENDPATDGAVDYIIGADMFLEKKIYDAQQGFDEKFFMYFEEADLQLRLSEEGYEHFLTSKTRIIHLEGGSQKKEVGNDHVPNRRRIMIHVSRNLYFRKHLAKWQYFCYILSEISLIPIRIISPNHSLKENFTFVRKCLASL